MAINEVLAYSFLYNTTGGAAATRANRFFIELVNTQTCAGDLGGDDGAGSTRGSTWAGLCTTRRLRRAQLIRIRGHPGTSSSRVTILTAGRIRIAGQLVPYAEPVRGDAAGASRHSVRPTAIAGHESNNPVESADGTPPGTAADGYDVVLQPLGITLDGNGDGGRDWRFRASASGATHDAGDGMGRRSCRSITST